VVEERALQFGIAVRADDVCQVGGGLLGGVRDARF
jgi:hypothetical protein